MLTAAPHARVTAALDRESARLGAPVALAVAAVLGAAALYQLVLFGRSVGVFVWGWLASAGALTIAGAWMRRRAPAHGHATLGAIALVGLANAMAFLVVVRDPVYTTVVLLAVVGHAILAISASWHLGIATTTLLAWLGVAGTDPYPGDWVSMGLLLACGVGMAGLAQILRVQDRTRLESARTDALDATARMQALSEAAFEGVALHDDGRILLANPAFTRLFGYSATELAGMSAAELVAPDSLPVLHARLAMPEDAPFELVFRRKDGSTFKGELAARDFPYEGRLVRVATVRDVTERDAAIAASKERDRLKALHDLRARFINDAAHQLNTPLTPIKLAAHLLSVGTLGPLTPRQAKAVDTIGRNADQLTVLARMLLDSNEADQVAALAKDVTTDLAAPLQDAIEAHAERARRIGVRVIVAPIPALLVRADGARLAQALRGLVGELLDAAPPDTTVGVVVRAEGGTAQLRLRRDPPPEGVDRSEAVTDEKEHLYVDLARRLVASHGGTLETRVSGASREYAIALRLATAPAPSSGQGST